MLRKTLCHCQDIFPSSASHQESEMFTGRIHGTFAIFLTALAMISGFLQYFGRPVDCVCPPEFTGSMVNYVNSLCYFNDRYYLPIDDSPLPEPLPSTTQVNYFKWTPFALFFFATLYIIPEIIVNVASKLFRVNLANILELSWQSSRGNTEQRESAIQQLTVDFQSRFHDEARSRRTLFRRWLKTLTPSLPCFVWLRNIAGKLIFATGSIVPIIFLYENYLLSFAFDDKVTLNDTNKNNQTYFPAVILCDFEIRLLGNLQRYSSRCHLPANDMFEKMSVLVSFLALVVSSVSSSDFITCLVASVFQPRKSSYITRHMALFADFSSRYDREICQAFVERYLREDGIYLLQLIGRNASQAVVSQLLSGLWKGYKTQLFEDKPVLAHSCDPVHNPMLRSFEVGCFE